MSRALVAAALVAVGFAAGWGLATTGGRPAADDAGGRVRRVRTYDGAAGRNAPDEDAAAHPSDGSGRRAHRDEGAAGVGTAEGGRHDEPRRSTGAAASATVVEVRGEDGQTVDGRAERFAREHPDACAALARRRERLRAARQTAAAERRAFLASVADEYLAADRRAAHAGYLAALETRDRLRERLAAERREGRPTAAEDREALTEAERTLRDGAASERQALFEAAARSVGLEGASASEFAGTLREIVESTPYSGLRE